MQINQTNAVAPRPGARAVAARRAVPAPVAGRGRGRAGAVGDRPDGSGSERAKEGGGGRGVSAHIVGYCGHYAQIS